MAGFCPADPARGHRRGPGPIWDGPEAPPMGLQGG